MRRRWFKIISLISSVFFGLTLVLTIAAFWLNPWKHRLSISDSFHIGLFRGFGDDLIGRIVLFNDIEYGTYRGSIIKLIDDEGYLLYNGGRAKPIPDYVWSVGDYQISRGSYVDERGNAVFIESSCDFPGIYYSYFETEEGVLWTLMFSFGYPLFLFAILPGLWICHRLLRRGHHKDTESQ